MILIADAGGTKTDWRLLNGNEIHQFATSGYNPNTHELSVFIKEVDEVFENVKSEVSELFFYGASLYPDDVDFSLAVGSVFPSAQVEVNNDLLGSCRALSAREPGFVSILGTGSAGCFYDGNVIKNHTPSLGYTLGDEGGGDQLGVSLLNLALRKRLEVNLQKLFDERYKLTKQDVYDAVYKRKGPNTYLASFAIFLNDHRNHPQIHALLVSNFEQHFKAYYGGMSDLKKYPFHFTGSIAYYFGHVLREVASNMGYMVGRIVKSPIAGLSLYHKVE